MYPTRGMEGGREGEGTGGEGRGGREGAREVGRKGGGGEGGREGRDDCYTLF